MAKRTLLHGVHVASGARMAEFAGWDMPVRYSDIPPEHLAVRERAGLFDVSHMGELRLFGPDALAAADRLVCNRIAPPDRMRASYSPMCDESGGTVDDLFVHAISGNEALLVVNAGNIATDAAHIRQRLPAGVSLNDESDEWLQIALQGPAALRIADRMSELRGCAELPFMGWMPVRWGEYEGFVSRSGYCGEDGLECYVRCGPDEAWAQAFWQRILDLGAPDGILPCGLGARDSLRLEAGLPLHGHELSRDISPVEAGLSRFVEPGKGPFVGRDVLAAQLRNGTPRRLAGLRLRDRGIPREGCEVTDPAENDRVVGRVTSGGLGLTIGSGIAMALLEADCAKNGKYLGIRVRDRILEAEVCPLPFRKRPEPTRRIGRDG